MRVSIAFAGAAMIALSAVPYVLAAEADGLTDARTRLARQLMIQPGDFEGNVPGAQLHETMPHLTEADVVTVPIRPVDRDCRGNRTCIQVAQDAYDYVRSVWSVLSPTSRMVCVASASYESATKRASLFYSQMRACADARLQAQDALERMSVTHFQP